MKVWVFSAEEGWHPYTGDGAGPTGDALSPEAARRLGRELRRQPGVVTTLVLSPDEHPEGWLARQAARSGERHRGSE